MRLSAGRVWEGQRWSGVNGKLCGDSPSARAMAAAHQRFHDFTLPTIR
jgi:hypothetical protein